MKIEYKQKGKVVFYEGDLPDKFFILLSGKVAIIKKKTYDLIENE